MFLDSCDNIHDAISDYITFCEDMIMPNKTVKIYPDNNSWVSKSLKKKTLNKKKIAFRLKTRLNGNVFKVNSERKSEKQGNSTKKKRKKFHTGNMQDAQKGLKTLA